MFPLPGDAEHGLIFRAEGDDHYAFSIRTDGQFTAYVDYEGEVRELLPWARSAAIRRDEANRLGVVAEGSHLTLLVNDEYVGEFDDETLSEGKAGLLMSLEHEGDEAGFDYAGSSCVRRSRAAARTASPLRRFQRNCRCHESAFHGRPSAEMSPSDLRKGSGPHPRECGIL